MKMNEIYILLCMCFGYWCVRCTPPSGSGLKGKTSVNIKQ